MPRDRVEELEWGIVKLKQERENLEIRLDKAKLLIENQILMKICLTSEKNKYRTALEGLQKHYSLLCMRSGRNPYMSTVYQIVETALEEPKKE